LTKNTILRRLLIMLTWASIQGSHAQKEVGRMSPSAPAFLLPYNTPPRPFVLLILPEGPLLCLQSRPNRLSSPTAPLSHFRGSLSKGLRPLVLSYVIGRGSTEEGLHKTKPIGTAVRRVAMPF
jgi:hypothetical protein